MICQVCGRALEVGQRFCSACGTRVALEPPAMGASGYPPVYATASPLTNRVERHLRGLGVLWCVYGAVRLVRGVIAVLVLHTMTLGRFGHSGWPFDRMAHPVLPVWIASFLPVIAVAAVLGTILSFVTGYALLTRRPWGRTLAMIVAILSLIKIPLGTALGIYTLWVLAPAASNVQYEAVAQR